MFSVPISSFLRDKPSFAVIISVIFQPKGANYVTKLMDTGYIVRRHDETVTTGIIFPQERVTLTSLTKKRTFIIYNIQDFGQEYVL